MKEKTRITPDNVDSTTTSDSILLLYLQPSRKVRLLLRASRNTSSYQNKKQCIDVCFTLKVVAQENRKYDYSQFSDYKAFFSNDDKR